MSAVEMGGSGQGAVEALRIQIQHEAQVAQEMEQSAAEFHQATRRGRGHH